MEWKVGLPTVARPKSGAARRYLRRYGGQERSSDSTTSPIVF